MAGCDYCRGPLGFDSKGLCAGCGAPRRARVVAPSEIVRREFSSRGRHDYGQILESVFYEPRFETVNTLQHDADSNLWHINGKPVIPQPDPERR